MVDSASHRTWFVTAIGWLAIFVGLVIMAAGALLAYAFNAAFGGPELDAQIATLADDPRVGAFSGWLLTHVSVVFIATIAFGFVVVTCAIGLLRRRNWGRIGLLAGLWLGIVVAIVGAVATLLLLRLFPDNAAKELVAAGLDFDRVMAGMMLLVVSGAMIFGSLAGSVIYRLSGIDARQEFDAA